GCCTMESHEIVIVGAGFAGAATAYHLTRQGRGGVLVIEQESIPGFHSSGRNAAMMRQCVPDPDLAALTRDGAAFLRNLPQDWPEPVQLKQNGSLLLGSGAGWQKLQQDAAGGSASMSSSGRRRKPGGECRCSSKRSSKARRGARATASSIFTRCSRAI